MDDDIERYYEDFNFPSADKLYKLMKKDNYEVTKKDIILYLSKKQEAQIFKEAKTSKKKQGHIISHSPNASWQLDIYFFYKSIIKKTLTINIFWLVLIYLHVKHMPYL